MKRFYKLSSHKKTDEGYVIQLDGKTVKTPSGQELAAPSEELANAIVTEWGAQEDNIVPDTMPLTQILTTAIDKMRGREEITKSLLKYLDTDLLCYRTAEPEALAIRQKECWDTWLSWFDEHFEVSLYTTYKIDALTQDEETHKRIWNYIEALDEYYFALLHIVTSLSGSVVLALAFLEGDAEPEQIFEAAQLEETYRSEIYNEAEHGVAPEQERSQTAMKTELDAAKQFRELLG